MKQNKLSSGSNMRWESMRMMLPEHIEALQQHKKETMKKQKPTLDQDKLEELSYVISESMVDNRNVRVVKFDPFEDFEYVGIITKVDTQQKRIRVEMEDDFEWVRLEDIVDIMFE